MQVALGRENIFIHREHTKSSLKTADSFFRCFLILASNTLLQPVRFFILCSLTDFYEHTGTKKSKTEGRLVQFSARAQYNFIDPLFCRCYILG